MAKKDFTKSAASSFFSGNESSSNIEPSPAPTPPSPVPASSTTSTPSVNSSFSIKPNENKKKDKRISLLVNSGEYEKFSGIAASLGYSNNDLINQLIREFINSKEKM